MQDVCVSNCKSQLANPKIRCPPQMSSARVYSCGYLGTYVCMFYHLSAIYAHSVQQCLKFGKFITTHGSIDKQLQTMIICSKP